MVVFRDGSHHLSFPHIELTLVSLQDGIYTYTWWNSARRRRSIRIRLRRRSRGTSNSATTAPSRTYGSLTYFGLANN